MYLPKEDLDFYKIGGAIRQECDIMEPYRIGKGGGSAFGGERKPNPNKPNEVIFMGPPDSIQCYYPFLRAGWFCLMEKLSSTPHTEVIKM